MEQNTAAREIPRAGLLGTINSTPHSPNRPRAGDNVQSSTSRIPKTGITVHVLGRTPNVGAVNAWFVKNKCTVPQVAGALVC